MLKQQPAFNCFADTEITISEESTYFNIFNSTWTKIFTHGKYSLVSVSIIAWLAYDINEGGENTAQNLGSCQKVIPRRNIIIETISKSHYHIDTFHWVTKRFGGQERVYSSRSGVDLHNRISLLFGSFTLFFFYIQAQTKLLLGGFC